MLSLTALAGREGDGEFFAWHQFGDGKKSQDGSRTGDVSR